MSSIDSDEKISQKIKNLMDNDLPKAMTTSSENVFDDNINITIPSTTDIPFLLRGSNVSISPQPGIDDTPKENSVNILNNNTDITYSDYSALVSANAQNKLLSLTGQANNALLKEADSKRFYNLSLKEIIDTTVITVIVIFSELLDLMKPEEVDKRSLMSFGQIANEYAQVFLKKDRIIYVGIFAIFISILFMTIFLSS